MERRQLAGAKDVAAPGLHRGNDAVGLALRGQRAGAHVVVALGQCRAGGWLDGVRRGQYGQHDTIVLIQGGERNTANTLGSAGGDVVVALMDRWQRDVVDGVS